MASPESFPRAFQWLGTCADEKPMVTDRVDVNESPGSARGRCEHIMSFVPPSVRRGGYDSDKVVKLEVLYDVPVVLIHRW